MHIVALTWFSCHPDSWAITTDTRPATMCRYNIFGLDMVGTTGCETIQIISLGSKVEDVGIFAETSPRYTLL